MALVNVVNMAVLDNPSQFLSPFSFEITFECLQPLADDLEWKVLYVGSAEDTSHDQVLDEILVGPIPVGINKFVLQADAPDIGQIPEGDVLGVTVVLVTCSYREKEFVRVGYYVNNEYAEPYDEEKGPPKPLDMNKVRRLVLSDKPRVTRFPIQWGDKEEPQQASQQDQNDHQAQQQQQQGQSMEGQMLEDAKGMTLDEMGGNGNNDAEFEEEEDDLSVEGKDMMMEDIAMMGNTPVSATAAME
mmetsp:Transcript_21547/g.52067  ORF Transcript_21547/g.52067 Transcript_21547/m.52067 type:complete len:244 (-) Transcript_21547:234-965(-)|eukprot:CAMPEP_0181126378 /NCGR_PEP_ID=MMETSP1071-20121207/27594_1 /TAXON_ID=35127 /ORGANISM="Thalassiosira sp., Strain NH16" /LENGTH=243 /DNA_ID=CAMNT_0023211969 /DNA_START=266 /DNA_END=997 /DNA_ORIENTATION=+